MSTVTADAEDEGNRSGVSVMGVPRCVAGAFIWALLWTAPLQAQSDVSHDFERINSNAAINIGIPLGEGAGYTSTTWGLTYGAGYNLSGLHALIGEVMWNSLYPTSAALAPFRAMTNGNAIKGHGNLVALTANYRLQFSRQHYGTYLIAGGGMYYRQASLSQSVSVGRSVTCNPAWLWWGFTCSSGVVTSNQVLGSSSSTVFGGNAGIGFTFAMPDSRYKIYVESRYHYAPHKGIATRLIPIVIGVRF